MSEQRRFSINPGPLKIVKVRVGDVQADPEAWRCAHVLRDGERCFRDHADDSFYCYQHRKLHPVQS